MDGNKTDQSYVEKDFSGESVGKSLKSEKMGFVVKRKIEGKWEAL